MFSSGLGLQWSDCTANYHMFTWNFCGDLGHDQRLFLLFNRMKIDLEQVLIHIFKVCYLRLVSWICVPYICCLSSMLWFHFHPISFKSSDINLITLLSRLPIEIFKWKWRICPSQAQTTPGWRWGITCAYRYPCIYLTLGLSLVLHYVFVVVGPGPWHLLWAGGRCLFGPVFWGASSC